jgi:hypothetical protein
MWFGNILQLFMLACLAVLVWYAGEALRVFNRLDASFDKLRAFLDAQDINRRADPKPGVSPASRHRPNPSVEIDVKSRRSGHHSPFASASASAQSSAPAQIAAGLGPRPSSSTVAATSPASRAPQLPPVKLTDSTRSVTLIGTMRAVPTPPVASDSAPSDEEPGNRTSWEPLKRGGMIGASLRPVAEPRFPGTQVSMQAVTPPGSASPASGRRAAPVEVKAKCRECDGGFVRVGAGGIGKCDACAGSGLVAMTAQV